MNLMDECIAAYPNASIRTGLGYTPGVPRGIDRARAEVSSDFRVRFGREGPATAAGKTLLEDWAAASLEAIAQARAAADLKPKLAAALAAEARRLGRDLSKDEKGSVIVSVKERFLPERTQAHLQPILATQASRARALDDSMRRERARLAPKPDPFAPLVRGDPKARAKEILLHETPEAMVVADLFARSPKVLVVPKRAVMFPSEASQGLLDHLASLARAASAAFQKAGAPAPAEVWVNPPNRLSLPRLHVHVQPHLPPWVEVRPKDNPAPTTEERQFYSQVARFFEALPQTLRRPR